MQAPGFHLTGCFIHDVHFLTSAAIRGDSSNKTSINESVLYFVDFNADFILTENDLTLRNSLITGSQNPSYKSQLLNDYGDSNNTVTASYCTFISNGDCGGTMVTVGKAINCIVSGTGDGIASDDHTYNLSIVSGDPYQDHNQSSASAGEGDIINQDPLFVDGTAIGSSVTIAANYQLQEDSPAVGYADPIGILFDLTGNARPEGGPEGSETNPDIGCFEYQFAPPPSSPWSSYGTQSSPNFDSGFTINLYQNLTTNYKLADTNSPGQVPFSLGPKGPGTLRGRLGAYGVSKGGDPSILIQTSSA